MSRQCVLVLFVIGGLCSGEGIPEGYVFIDGAYVDRPYVVTACGELMSINGMAVAQTGYAAPCIRGPAPDVQMPASISEVSAPDDRDVCDYLDKKMLYVRSRNYPRAETARRMAAVYASMPCVAAAGLAQDHDAITLTWRGRAPIDVRLFGPPGGGRGTTDSRSLQARIAEQVKGYVEDELRKGSCFLFFNCDGYIEMGPGRAAEMVPKMAHVLTAAHDPEGKLKGLLSIGLHEMEIPEFRAFIDRLTAPPQLQLRLQGHQHVGPATAP